MIPSITTPVRTDDLRRVLEMVHAQCPPNSPGFGLYQRLTAALVNADAAALVPAIVKLGERKIDVIKVIRKHTGAGLAEAVDYSERPIPIRLTEAFHTRGLMVMPPDMKDGSLDEFIKDLNAAGATVEDVLQ